MKCILQDSFFFLVEVRHFFCQVTTIIVDETESLYLEREARKWATEVAKMSKIAEGINKQIADCQSNAVQLKVSFRPICCLWNGLSICKVQFAT